MSVQPIFLISLPRSGSTLVQRVLAAHHEVATTAEPWLLMPFFASAGKDLPSLGAWDRTSAGAIDEFAGSLPRGRSDLRAAMHDYAVGLYEKASPPGTRFFVDKSPPYSLFVDELAAAFPEARIVVLWRNPLAVVASIVETFCDGRWAPDRYRVSLFDALEALDRGAGAQGAWVTTARYEDLVTGGEDAWRPLVEALGIEFDPVAINKGPAAALPGTLGDPTGTVSYETFSPEPLSKWRRTINSPVRRHWCRRYLDWIGAERLERMGYDHAELLEELRLNPVGLRGAPGDTFRSAEAAARRAGRRFVPAKGTPAPGEVSEHAP